MRPFPQPDYSFSNQGILSWEPNTTEKYQNDKDARRKNLIIVSARKHVTSRQWGEGAEGWGEKVPYCFKISKI